MVDGIVCADNASPLLGTSSTYSVYLGKKRFREDWELIFKRDPPVDKNVSDVGRKWNRDVNTEIRNRAPLRSIANSRTHLLEFLMPLSGKGLRF